MTGDTDGDRTTSPTPGCRDYLIAAAAIVRRCAQLRRCRRRHVLYGARRIKYSEPMPSNVLKINEFNIMSKLLLSLLPGGRPRTFPL
jgi:hypothetical protein